MTEQKERKTIAVCTRFIPAIGEKDTAVMILTETMTVGQINAWCDKLCRGDAVCMGLELVDEYRGD